MSTDKSSDDLNFGVRLVQERRRLKIKQADLAKLLDRSKVTQVSYEAGLTCPDAEYLSALDKLGADIYYIITGEQPEAIRGEGERQLVSGYRSLGEQGKNLALNILKVIVEDEADNKKNAEIKKPVKK